MSKGGSTRGRWIGLLLVVIGAVVAVVIFRRDSGSAGANNDDRNPQRKPAEEDVAQLFPVVMAFCGDCHAIPTPDQFPRDGWADEVDQGYDLYAASGRTDLVVPPKRDVRRYYRQLTPEKLTLKPAAMTLPPGRLQFKQTSISLTSGSHPPAISNVAWMGSGGSAAARSSPLRLASLFACDMRSGLFAELTPRRDQSPIMGRRQHVGHPGHTALVDFDGDGQMEVLVADLGSFQPADHDKGRVLLLVPTPGGSDPFKVHELATGLGRVTDVRPGDFDNDGDDDLIVAEFGWRTSGRIFLMENLGGGPVPNFRQRVIDDRHGCIHVPTADVNGDGHLDFVAVISQEHEVVEAFLNRGNGTFRRQLIYAGNNPSHGTSGMELSDLDGDGDIDVIVTNGDMFDQFYIMPYHGVRWIENSEGRWVTHDLCSMPGVHRAVPGDLDNDGDIDIVASALVSNRSMAARGQKGLDSLIWLEQVKPGKFEMRSIEAERCYHPTLDLADFDGDNDLDIVVGEFREEAGPAHLTIWWNQLVELK